MNTELCWWENTELHAGWKLVGCFNHCYNEKLGLVLEGFLVVVVFLSPKLRLIQTNCLYLLLLLIPKISPKQK